MRSLISRALGLITLGGAMNCGFSAVSEESASISLDAIRAVLGTPFLDHQLHGPPDRSRRQLSYRDETLLLVSSPHALRLSGITLLIVDGQLRRVEPSYYESAQHDDKAAIMRTGIDPLDMGDDPVRYFESIVIEGKDRPANARRRALYGQVLLLAYSRLELNQDQEIGSLSMNSDIVQAIVTGFRVPAHSLHSDETGRIRPSRLWRLIRVAIATGPPARESGTVFENAKDETRP